MCQPKPFHSLITVISGAADTNTQCCAYTSCRLVFTPHILPSSLSLSSLCVFLCHVQTRPVSHHVSSSSRLRGTVPSRFRVFGTCKRGVCPSFFYRRLFVVLWFLCTVLVSGSRPGCPLISPRSPFFSSRPSIKVLHGLKQSTCGWRCPRTLHSVHCLTLETPRQKLLSAGPQQMSVGHNVIPPLYIGLTTGYLSFKKTFFLLLEEMLTGSECGFSLVGELYSKPVR